MTTEVLEAPGAATEATATEATTSNGVHTALSPQPPQLSAPPLEDQAPRLWKWTREWYYKLGELGAFQGQRVQLIDGEVWQMYPMAEPHAVGVTKGNYKFVRSLDETRFHVRVQLPLRLSDGSEPEPDIAIVAGPIGSGDVGGPTSALLVIEISDSTLCFDRTIKASLYASAGVPEYWILNLVNNRLERHREPVEDALQPHGWMYGTVEFSNAEAIVAPLCAPDVSMIVSELLP